MFGVDAMLPGTRWDGQGLEGGRRTKQGRIPNAVIPGCDAVRCDAKHSSLSTAHLILLVRPLAPCHIAKSALVTYSILRT